MNTVETIPDDALEVSTDHNSKNYVRFSDVRTLEWFTDFAERDEIAKEVFIKDSETQ